MGLGEGAGRESQGRSLGKGPLPGGQETDYFFHCQGKENDQLSEDYEGYVELDDDNDDEGGCNLMVLYKVASAFYVYSARSAVVN